MCRIGGVSANFVGPLADVNESLPNYIFAFMALVATIAMLFLPETGHLPMPNTLDEMERIMK